jgi:DMSO/TMAO reductase YedYZ molybdopterin-dependent catalytic subunit
VDKRSALEMMKPLTLRDGGQLDPVNTSDFFVLSPYKGPEINVREWSLSVGGLVKRPREFSHADLTGSFTKIHEFATLECVINEAGGSMVGNALWSGVALREVLDDVGVAPGSVEILFKAADGLSSSLPLDEGLMPRTLLSYEMNGRPLPIDNGFPMRLVVPGFYGFRWRKWLTRIEAIGERFTSPQYLENPPKAERLVLTTKLLRPRRDTVVPRGPLSVVGASWGSEAGIERVDVSVDRGVTWDRAEIVWRPPSPHAWTIWELLWEPSGSGVHTITARATDMEGRTQPVTGSEPYPSGLADLDRVKVVVR